jgi:hypothetical protein
MTMPVGSATRAATVPTTRAVVRAYASTAADWATTGAAPGVVSPTVVTMRGGSADPVTRAVYAVAAGALLVFAVWTAATAARGSVIFFKICPVVKSLAAALLIAAIAL